LSVFFESENIATDRSWTKPLDDPNNFLDEIAVTRLPHRQNLYVLMCASFCCLIIGSCDSSKFDEYTAAKYISNKEQERIVDKFIKFSYSQIEVNPADSSLLHKMWRLKYYLISDQKQYYMITYKGNFF
jgi:hypothetical protein